MYSFGFFIKSQVFIDVWIIVRVFNLNSLVHVSVGGDSCVALSILGVGAGFETIIYPWCKNWLFVAHSLLWDALLRLDPGEAWS